MTNREVAKILRETAQLLEVDGAQIGRYRILETRAPADGVLLGYLRADFEFADGTALPLNLGVLLTRTGAGWRIAHYQVSSPVPG